MCVIWAFPHFDNLLREQLKRRKDERLIMAYGTMRFGPLHGGSLVGQKMLLRKTVYSRQSYHLVAFENWRQTGREVGKDFPKVCPHLYPISPKCCHIGNPLEAQCNHEVSTFRSESYLSDYIHWVGTYIWTLYMRYFLGIWSSDLKPLSLCSRLFFHKASRMDLGLRKNRGLKSEPQASSLGLFLPTPLPLMQSHILPMLFTMLSPECTMTSSWLQLTWKPVMESSHGMVSSFSLSTWG